jgi:drug/metabolite transporter (DMT)-like permease
VAIVVWGLADAVQRPEAAFARVGQNKILWVAIQAVGLLFCLAGAVLSAIYLAAIRPKVRAAEIPPST